MKKIFAILGILAIAACSKDMNSSVKTEGKIPLEFSAEGARTIMNSVNVFWEKGDEISILDGKENERFSTTNSGISAIFKGSAYDSGTYYAVYPYQEGTSLSGSVITASVPDEQIARKGNFGKGANLTAGKAAGRALTMKNVCGYVKFSIGESNKYINISVSSISGEKIAGPFNISFNNEGIPSTAATEGGKTTIKLAPESGSFAKGDYWVVLAPGSLSKGLRFILAGTDGNLYKKDISFYKSTDRNVPYNIGRIDEGLEKIAAGLTLDPSTKTNLRAGDQTATLKLVTNCAGVSAAIKGGSSLTGATITKISDTEFSITGITNASDDPKDIRTLTVVCSAAGAADLEVTFKQPGTLTWMFYTGTSGSLKVFGLPMAKPAASVNPAKAMDPLVTSKGNEYVLYQSGYVYGRDVTSSSGVAINTTGRILFPAIVGYVLKAVKIEYRYHSSFPGTKDRFGGVTDLSFNDKDKTATYSLSSEWYSGLFNVSTFESGSTIHTYVLGEKSEGEADAEGTLAQPEAGAYYVLNHTGRNCIMRNITLFYEYTK